VDLFHLLGCSILTCSNSPNRLVSKYDVFPVGDQRFDGFELFLDNLDGLIILSLRECLSKAVDHLESGLQSDLYFFSQDFIGLAKMGPPFRVTNDDPFDIDIPKLFGSDFSSVCTESESRAVLGGDLYVLVLFGEHDGDKMKVDRGDDDV
jgi:hypothetical protein